MAKEKYYTLKNILEKDAQYNIIFGERSNGKTYALLKYGLERFCKYGEQFAIVRRWQDDFIGKRGATMFNALVVNDVVSDLTDGMWTDVYYYASKWFLCTYDDESKRITAEKPFAYGFSLSAMEHDKSTSYPEITTVIFDEFLTRTAYLNDEFVMFMNVLSTIIRQRVNVKIFMLGNTVNKYCPYFHEMGLSHIKEMEQGTIDVYNYGQSALRVAVEYCATMKAGKKSDVYFAFDNPKLNMITGGAWELDIYPHCPCKYTPSEVLFTYFIVFDGQTLQCEVVLHEALYFTFIHLKTTDIKGPDTDIIFSTQYDPRPNWIRNIRKPTNDITRRIYGMFTNDAVYYQNNEVGEIVRNYLQWCGKSV